MITGIGIDDKTAICIDENKIGTVYGNGAVSIFQFDDKSKITTDNNQYKIENLLCNKLLHEWEFNFNENIIHYYPESAKEKLNSENVELPKTDIYLTGSTDNIISVFPDLDFFINNANTSLIGIIGDSGNEDYQLPLINELQKLNVLYNLILVDSDSLNNEILNLIIEIFF